MPYLLKGCVRCGGDLCEGWDFREGFYRSCLQCGRRRGDGHTDVRGPALLGAAATARHNAPVTPSHQARPP
jgi:hypothetical protein